MAFYIWYKDEDKREAQASSSCGFASVEDAKQEAEAIGDKVPFIIVDGTWNRENPLYDSEKG